MNINELNWQDLRLFLSVAEQGSFSGAARELKLGQPTLSRRIAELEEQLGQPLFVRKSRGCELTALAQRLLPAAEQMAAWSVEALAQAQVPDKIQGRVRVTAPPAIAFALLAPFAAQLAQAHPGIQLEVISDIDTLNLARGEADLSLRIQKPEDDALVCLASFEGQLKVYASPTYAAKLQSNPNIQSLDWICWPDDYDFLEVNQILKREIPHFQPVFTSNDYNVQIAACCSGVGVLALPEGFEHCSFLNNLIPLPIDLRSFATGEMHIVVHKRQQYLPRIGALSDFLQNYLEGIWPEGLKTL